MSTTAVIRKRCSAMQVRIDEVSISAGGLLTDTEQCHNDLTAALASGASLSELLLRSSTIITRWQELDSSTLTLRDDKNALEADLGQADAKSTENFEHFEKVSSGVENTFEWLEEEVLQLVILSRQ